MEGRVVRITLSPEVVTMVPASNPRRVLTGATGAVVMVAALFAAPPALSQADRPLAVTSSVEVSSFESALDHARSLAVSGRFREARGEYERIAKAQLASGTLPAEALSWVAQLHYGDGRHRQAAAVLTTLARHAEAMGDPVVQAIALLEATLIHYALGATDEYNHGVKRLDQLRASPFLPDALRTSIEDRLALS